MLAANTHTCPSQLQKDLLSAQAAITAANEEANTLRQQLALAEVCLYVLCMCVGVFALGAHAFVAAMLLSSTGVLRV